MNQTTVSSSWKLPWHILGVSNKKPRADRSAKKVSSLRRRLQAHAAIARSLSPFCARTSFDSTAMPEQENKCLLSLSAFMNVCSRCALRDAHVPPLHSPLQQKAYIKAIHHHLHETSLHLHTKTASSRRAHKVFLGDASHTELSYASREPVHLQRDHHHSRHMKPSKKGESMKRIEAYKCKENEIKPYKQDKHHKQKQYRQGEVITRGEVKTKKHGKSHHKLEVYSFDSPDTNRTENSHHCTPSTSSLSRKGIHRLKDLNGLDNNPIEHASHGTKASITLPKKIASHPETLHRNDSSMTRKTTGLEADLYLCTTTHVLEQHKGKMKAFEEGVQQPALEGMHQYTNQDPPILNTHHNHASTDPPLKSKHVRKSGGIYWIASEDPQSRHYQHTSKNPSLRYFSLKEYNASSECYAGNDPLSLKCSESNANKNPLMSLKGSESYAKNEPFPVKASESYENKEPLSLKGSDFYTNKELLKVTLSPAYKDIEGDINDIGRKRQDHEKVKLRRLDHHKVSGGVWMQDTIPVVKYSHNPYVDFHNSMLEMLLGKGLKDLHELQDMFVCYVLLNSPCNQKHIEKAFRDLLTDLYKCKLMSSLQLDESSSHPKNGKGICV